MEEQPTLKALWQTRRGNLHASLDKCNTPADARPILQRFFRDLLEEYYSVADPATRHIIQPLEIVMMAAMDLLLAAGEVKVEPKLDAVMLSVPLEGEEEQPSGEVGWLVWLPLTVAVLLSLWLLLASTGPLEKIVALALGVAAIAAQVYTAVYLPWKRRPTPLLAGWLPWTGLTGGAVSKRSSGLPLPSAAQLIDAAISQGTTAIEVDTAAVMRAVENLIEAADRLLNAQSSRQEQPASGLPDSVIDYLHELAAANARSDEKYERIVVSNINRLFARLKIVVLNDFNGDSTAHFIELPNPDPAQTKPIVYKPALLQNQHQLRAGEVLIPRSTSRGEA